MVARARACVGARFRPQGRDPAFGLDCVGLAARAAGVARVPARYPMRGGAAAEIVALVEAAGLAPVAEPAAGDVVLVRAGPRQFHLVVMTGAGFVHADAGLRRVVEAPGAVPWPVVGVWRANPVQVRSVACPVLSQEAGKASAALGQAPRLRSGWAALCLNWER